MNCNGQRAVFGFQVNIQSRERQVTGAGKNGNWKKKMLQLFLLSKHSSLIFVFVFIRYVFYWNTFNLQTTSFPIPVPCLIVVCFSVVSIILSNEISFPFQIIFVINIYCILKWWMNDIFFHCILIVYIWSGVLLTISKDSMCSNHLICYSNSHFLLLTH